MAGEKTEEPTEKRLRDARLRGQVCKSQEIASTAVVLTVFGFVWLAYDWFVQEVSDLFRQAVDFLDQPFETALSAVARAGFGVFALTALGCALLAATAGCVGHLAQTGLLFAWKAATPKLDKLNPKQWFLKVFSVRNGIEFLRSLAKLGIVCLVFYLVFVDSLPEILRLPGHGVRAADVMLRTILVRATLYSSAAFAAVAAVDWVIQRRQFLKEHRMTKEEVKNEYKEMEGDPRIKGQRRQLHQEMAMRDQAQGVRSADVLVTNPTHLAIALEYKEGETPLPVILAKGEGHLAARMVAIAEEAGVPIMRNVPLAHDLWEQGTELHYIPTSLIEPVAEVLRWLRELKEREGGAS